jgi:formate hydrogenlyase subunit 3/multisubunit Na+/H+ antiporter MnhD subunit
MNEVFTIIFLPLVIAILMFILPDRYRTLKGVISIIVSICSLCITIILFGSQPGIYISDSGSSFTSGISFLNDLIGVKNSYFIFNNDNLSGLIILFISLFAFLVLLYSVIYNRQGNVRNYYSYFLATLGCSFGAVLADNLLLFLFFWGILGITLYKLIPGHDEKSSAAAKKTLILIGASDSIMIIGIAIIWRLTGTLSMQSISLPVNDLVTLTAFLTLLTGSFTKAGAFPLHSWVPDYAETAPASSTAYLPASIDKLLGIYFLARLTNSIFVLNEWISLFLLIIGVITIISAVMMALVQHEYKKLLGFHAVSQVGYMILGFGLGSMIGIAAGLFHMINNAVYKSGLFLSAGAVEYRTGKQNIDDLGGLSRAMPVTFIASLIFALSISGVPPFNGFASKWMIYQGIIEFGNGPGIANKLWVVWLSLAVLGSALTMASFIKFIGGIFLSRRKPELENIKEVPAMMWIPMAVLALLCVLFGIFATNFVVPELLMPVSGRFEFIGFWSPMPVSFLVLVSILLGVIIYMATSLKTFRREDSFIGGEKIQEETSYHTPEFYKTITEFRLFAWGYKKAGEKWFDIYDLFKQFVLRLSHILSEAHSGVLPGYILWVFAGLIIMLLIMI